MVSTVEITDGLVRVKVLFFLRLFLLVWVQVSQCVTWARSLVAIRLVLPQGHWILMLRFHWYLWVSCGVSPSVGWLWVAFCRVPRMMFGYLDCNSCSAVLSPSGLSGFRGRGRGVVWVCVFIV